MNSTGAKKEEEEITKEGDEGDGSVEHETATWKKVKKIKII